jgi:hypothetical protein
MLRLRLLSVSAIATVLFASTSLSAQQAPISQGPVSSRVVVPVNDSKLVALPGRVSLLVRSEFDLGRASASTQMTSVRLVLARSPQQEAALESFMTGQLDPASPNYRKWLSPDQLGNLYGPSDVDIQTLVTWLQSRGFTVQSVPQGRVSIAFAGSVSQIEAAFHTEIHSFNANGEEFLSNTSNPKVPSALASVISGIAGLNTIKPRAHNVPAKSGMYDPLQKHFVSADRDTAGSKPLLTVGSSSSGYELFLVPADAATIYDTPNNFNAGFSSGSSFTGAGVTIGIGGDAPIQATTVASYRTQFLTDLTLPTITTVGTAPTSTEDTDEAYIDTELSGGLAPGSTINFYTAVNLSDAINQAIEDNTVDIFSLSFGNCEADLSTADNALLSGWWQQAASQGIAVTVSTGDSGAAGCDNENTQQAALYGLQVNGFASTPYNIAVGGTDFPGLLSNFSGYVGTTNGNYYGSARGYIPESTWNNSAVTDGLLAQNTPYKNSSAQTGIVGGSGGASSCSTNANNATNTTIATCTSGYTKPSWQTGSGVPTDGVRDLPDVSLFASNGFDGAAWLVCTDDSFTQGGVTYITNCEAQNGGGFSFSGFGGTSTSAPAFAGILALAQQRTGSRLGLAAQTLYRIYNGPHSSAVFHDTTVGNISVPCTSGTPNCSKNSAGYDFLTEYNTTAGYDLATGLGSVDVTNLLNYWNSSTGTATATVGVDPSPTSVYRDQTLSVTVAVTGASGTPTGTVKLSIGTYSSSEEQLSSGSYTFSFPASSIPQSEAAIDVVVVTYHGDSTYAPTTGSSAITVSSLNPAVSVTPASSSISASQSLPVTIAISGPAGSPVATGVVTLSTGNYISNSISLSSGSAVITIPGDTFTTAGLLSINVYYSGDSIYSEGHGSAGISVTIPTLVTPTVTVTPASSSIDSGQSLAVSVTVAGSGGTPTGTVTLTSGSYTSSAATLASGAASITIPANSLAAGTDTLSVSYGGDGNYAQATGSASVTVTASTFTLAGPSTQPTISSPGGTATSSVIITSVNGYAGNIALTCTLTSSPSSAVDAPACTLAATDTLNALSSITQEISFSTTAASSAVVPGRIASSGRGKPGSGRSEWTKAAAATLLAFVVFLGIPARRPAWRAVVGMLVLIAALGALSACGSANSGSGGGGGGDSTGTTAGTYTFTVTATGTPAVSPAPTATIALTVN